MKKSILFLFAIIGGLFLSSCDNEFTVIDNWREVTVIYGLLNVNDTAQYIRVEKAFLDPETDAFVIAQIADSLFFENAAVTLRETAANGNNGSVIQLTRVDANEEGFQREDGVFANSPNYVFKTTETINPLSNYEIEVLPTESSDVVTANTEVIAPFEILTPPAPTLSTTFRLWNQLQEARFSWDLDEDAKFFDLTLRIQYRESDGSNLVTKTIDWTLAQKLEPAGASVVTIDNISHTLFLEFLANNLDPLPNGCREIVDIDVLIDAGGEEFLNYVNVSQANIGITGSVPLNEYTNLSEGRGVFSTRYNASVEGILISAQVVDELAFSNITSGLSFRSFGDPACN